VWASTVFILIYDENDGLFDHVTPPAAPAGTADEYITVDNVSQPIGLGFRVPAIIVSPWTTGGFVCHDVFDHTSVIRFLERLTGVVEPNISAWRRSTVGDLTTTLGVFPERRFPRLPDTTPELLLAEQEVRTLQLPPYPGAAQTFPVQLPGNRPTAPGTRPTPGGPRPTPPTPTPPTPTPPTPTAPTPTARTATNRPAAAPTTGVGVAR